MQTRRHILTTAAAAAFGASSQLIPRPAQAAPRARLIDRRWTGFGAAAEPDHGAWDAFLRAHVKRAADGINRVDYAAARQPAVGSYIAALTAVDPATLPSAAAFAYWTNLYNALTVHIVLGAYPVSSIRRIGGTLLSPGPWRDRLVTVAGQPLSLDDIEHGILRPVWRDPRVHYAVNCAALGCPNLAPQAFAAGRLARMLDDGARAFINHPRGARLEAGALRVSSIYTWFRADFGGADAGVISHLKQYASGPLAAGLAGVTRIAGDSYDWALNRS